MRYLTANEQFFVNKIAELKEDPELIDVGTRNFKSNDNDCRIFSQTLDLLVEERMKPDNVIEYYKDTMYQLLDRIGVEKVKEYFNLIENEQ